ncbi:unnamed protein product [Blepharisma stoltei]|uniref:CRAL-TRIO domain-containing protein n=1 Tax=Blepharisma stoltei TaxID=1481888 RepID=A0AAU9KCU1_9CILI|nr:unnamed protein product [Blepharisma stoltei]
MHKIKLRNAPPKAAYLYWPDGEQALIEAETYVERLIFDKQEYKEWELSHLGQLEKLLHNCTELAKSELLRFLYGQGWDLKKTVEAIKAHYQWKSEWPNYMSVYPLVQNILNSGGVYIHGRDIYYRPLIILKLSKLAQFPYQEHIACAYFLLEFIMDSMFLPGQIENWVMIVDFEDFNEVNQNHVRKLIMELYTHYQCRLAKAYVINPSRLWKLLINLLPNNTLKKFVVDDVEKQLLKDFGPSQLEIKYGGTASNLKRFWPPRRLKYNPCEDVFSSCSSIPDSPLKQNRNSFETSIRLEGCSSFLSSNMDFKEEIWEQCEQESNTFSFLQENEKNIEEEHQDVINFENFAQSNKEVKSPSEEMTRASLKVPIPPRTFSIENYEIEPVWFCNACVGDKNSSCCIM